jgi:hypothetical protein
MDVAFASTTWAWDLANSALPESHHRRWVHSVGVAARAADLSGLFGPHNLDVLISAAILHDVGYADGIATTGFPSLDGARWLASRGADQEVTQLVAHHWCATIEAEMRGLAEELALFPVHPNPDLADALIFCDLTTSWSGRVTGIDERLAEFEQRYGPEDLTTRIVRRGEPDLRAAAARVLERL